MFNAIKTFLASVLVAASLMVAPVSAQAALPDGVAAVFTGVGANFTDAAALAWPVFLIIVGGLILFGIVKKVLHKAAG